MRWAEGITRLCLRCSFWLLLLMALLLLAARLLAPQVSGLQPQLTSYLQQQLQTPVSMSGLQAGWIGARPFFLLDDLSIGAGDAQLYLGKVRVYLRPLRLLRPGRNALQMEVINARLALQQTDRGWSLSGLSAAAGGSEITAGKRRQTLQQLLERGDLRLVDAAVSIFTRAAADKPLQLLVEYADVSRFADASWRAGLQQMAPRPAGLATTPEPQLTAVKPDLSGYGLQLRLRPLLSEQAVVRGASSAQQASISLALQLRFSAVGMSAEGYVDLPQQTLAPWQPLLLALQGVAAADGQQTAAAARSLQLSSRVWFGWREKDYLQLRGEFDMRQRASADAAIRKASALNGVVGDFEWLSQPAQAGQPANWALLLDQLASPDDYSDAGMIMAAGHGDGGWTVHADDLQPGHINELAAALETVLPSLPLSALRQSVADWLALEHSGSRIDIAELRVDRDQRILAARVSAEQLLLKPALLASGEKAGAAASDIVNCGPFDLHLQIDEQLGWFSLDAEAAVCSLPGLVRAPLLLDQFTFAGQIEQLQDGFRIADARGDIRTPDFSLQSQLRWRFDRSGSSGVVHAHMPVLLAAQLKNYLPLDNGKFGTVRWIERAMQGGWLRDLRVSWPIGGSTAMPQATTQQAGKKLPSDRQPGAKQPWGSLRLSLDLDDVLMDYARDWPPAQSMQASLRIAGNQLQATATRARMLEVELSQVSARIDELFSNAKLHLHSNLHGAGEQMLDLLASMPITGNDFSARDYRLRGPIQAQADIGIDLAGQTSLLYASGAAGLRGVTAVTSQITINDIKGELGFDADGPTDSTLHGYWLERHARLDWKRTAAGPEIRMQGRFPSQQVAHAALDLPGLIPQYIAGTSLWKLRLLLERDPTTVLGYSDLAGTEIRLPAPLSKLAAVRRPLRLALPLGSGQRSIAIHHGDAVDEYADSNLPAGLLTLQLLQLEDGGVAAADLQFDAAASSSRPPLQALAADRQQSAPLQAGELRFSGHADAVAALDWAGVLLDYQRDVDALPRQVDSGHANGNGFSIDSDLRTDNLLLGQRNLGPAALRIAPCADTAAMAVAVRSQTPASAVEDTSQACGLGLLLQGDNIAGTADIVNTATGTLINVDMSKLYLPPAGPGLNRATSASAATPTSAQAQSASNLTVNLIADEVRYEQLDLGVVRLELVPMINGLSLQRLEASSDSMNINASGGWQTQQGKVQSQLEMRLDSNDMGTVLRGLGYDELVRNAQTTMLLDVNWPGDITRFKWQKLQGFLDVQTGHGVIPKASPGAGRALGLLSLQALPKRMFLDFSDVFADGMEFENASGRFVFDNGIASAEDVVINAAAANIRMTGTTDLVARTYNQRLVVEPASSFALPLIGAIAGGPIGAGAGFALQSLFSGPIGEISKLEYQITGPWQDPNLTAYSAEPTVKINEE